MKKFLQQLQYKLRYVYGTDHLNKFLNILVFILIIINIFLRSGYFFYVELVLLCLLFFRTFSKNHVARRKENNIFLQWTKPIRKTYKRIKLYITDFPKYKHLKCPNCKVTVRIPRHKGKIMVHCPKCKHDFKAKS